MGKKLEIYVVEWITEIGSEWWETKLKEFNFLPYLNDEKLNVYFKEKMYDSQFENNDDSQLLIVNFNFFDYAYDSEGCLHKLDTAIQLCDMGQLREVDYREKPGLIFVKNKILEAVNKTANKFSAS